jgi:hypothetical protein
MPWLKQYAHNLAAFAWGVAEGTLFFIVPDVILTWIGVTRGLRAAGVASLWAACGAAFGGVGMHLWSQHAAAAARAAVREVPAITEAMISGAQTQMEAHWFSAMMLGPLSSTPYKVYAVLAPHAGVGMLVFALASVLARLPRFLIAGFAAAAIGRALAKRLSPRAILMLLAGFWSLFYVVFFTLMPSAETAIFE